MTFKLNDRIPLGVFQLPHDQFSRISGIDYTNPDIWVIASQASKFVNKLREQLAPPGSQTSTDIYLSKNVKRAESDASEFILEGFMQLGR